mgnify:CR=1 FL=1
MRTFVGLPVPESWHAALAGAQAHIPVGRAVDASDLHVTLAFLGEQEIAALEALHESLERRRLAPAELNIVGLALFGGARPKLLAADLQPTESLRALRASVKQAVREAGIGLERTRFRPHITLVRFGSGLAPDRLPALSRALSEAPPVSGRSIAHRLVLYRSHLGPGGAEYEELASYPLI